MDRPARVLCVGGEGTSNAAVSELLAETTVDIDVTRVADPDAALDELDVTAVDCVVVSLDRPGGPGVAALTTLGERAPEVPIVAAIDGPADDRSDLAVDALDAGVSQYVYLDDAVRTPALLARQVTDAIDREQRARELDRYRGLVATVGDPMYVLDPEGTITFTNAAMLQMLGCGEDEVVGHHATETMSEGDFERGTELLQQILQDPDRDWGTFEVTVTPVTGDPIPAEINLAPLRDDAGAYEATVGVVRDISTRKRREHRLGALHDTTRQLMDATTVDAVLRTGVEAAAEVLGLEMATFFRVTADGETLEPATYTDGVRELLGDPRTFEAGEGLVWQAHETGEAIFADDVQNRAETVNPNTSIHSEIIIPAGDHGVFVASSTEQAGFDATDEELAGVLVSNLTRAIESVLREDRLRDRERELEQYETIVHTIPDEVYTLDADGRFTSVIPPTGSDLTTSGYDPSELIGEHVSKVMDEDDVEEGRSQIKAIVGDPDRKRASFEIEILTRSGDRIPNENHIAFLPRSEDGEFRGTVGVLRNITERRKRERELERQNERLEEFAHIASHDLRNPINVAAGRLELARAECDSDHLDHLGDALDRMETLIDDTLTMATEGQTVTAVETVDLGEFAINCWDAVPDDDATLAVRDDLTIEADPDRLARLLENLFRNAAEHAGPAVSVRLGSLPDGFYVADDGPGIPEADRDEIFEAGTTTADDGTGFGLAIVEEIVQAHGWTVRVEESEAGGARFEITGVTLV